MLCSSFFLLFALFFHNLWFLPEKFRDKTAKTMKPYAGVSNMVLFWIFIQNHPVCLNESLLPSIDSKRRLNTHFSCPVSFSYVIWCFSCTQWPRKRFSTLLFFSFLFLFYWLGSLVIGICRFTFICMVQMIISFFDLVRVWYSSLVSRKR